LLGVNFGVVGKHVLAVHFGNYDISNSFGINRQNKAKNDFYSRVHDFGAKQLVKARETAQRFEHPQTKENLTFPII